MAVNSVPVAADSWQDRRINGWIRLGALATLLGMACSLLGWVQLGAWLFLPGLVVLLWNLHRLGRSGAG